MVSQIHAFFYKNNFIRTRLKFCPEIKNKLRTLGVRLQMNCNCKFLLKNTTHHVITCGVSLHIFLQYRKTECAEKKIKTAPHVFIDSAEVYLRQY